MGTILSEAIDERAPWFAFFTRAKSEDQPTVHLSDSDRNVTPRSSKRQMIVCGDCAGDQRLPRKTLLAADGTCETCGGNSYLLASRFFFFLAIEDDGEQRIIDEATHRRRDLARIYELAEGAGLITYDQNQRRETKPYRDWLKQYCTTFGLEGVTSATGLNQQQRARVIKALASLNFEQLV